MTHRVFTTDEYAAALREAGLLAEVDDEAAGIEVRHLSIDSRNIEPKTLFIAKGARFLPKFLDEAFARGAAVYVAQERIGTARPLIRVNDVRAAMACLARKFYNEPNCRLRLFGITGTKGKTTSAYFLRAIIDGACDEVGKPRCAYTSTVNTYDGKEYFESTNTTPESPELYRHMANAVDSGIEDFVVEVSSQALKYHRVDGITFDVACFTNIGVDHISDVEHSDFNDYFSSKLKIFDACKIACVNIDDAMAPEVLRYIGNRVPVVTFGTASDATLRCSGARARGETTEFDVFVNDEKFVFTIGIAGEFNVLNATAALAMAYAAGMDIKAAAEPLARARVDGRMMIFGSEDGEVTVIVDDAHNKMSFEALYDMAEQYYPEARLVSVYGCTGEKAQNRRKDVGLVSGERCSLVVITEKDPANEPFEDIAEEIAKYVARGGCPYEIVRDREEALRRAVNGVSGKRVVLFTGRGNETKMKRGDEFVDYPSDVDITKRLLAEYNAAVGTAR